MEHPGVLCYNDRAQTLQDILMKSSTVWHGHSTQPSLPAGTARKGKENLLHGRRNRLITPSVKKNRKFPLGNSLLYISLSSVALIASFTSRANLNNLFAICNSRLLSTNQIVNCDGRVRPQDAPCFFTMLHRFLRAASGIRHQHGSESDAAHPGFVPIFCAEMPCKLARKQCHFPAYCSILSA